LRGAEFTRSRIVSEQASARPRDDG